MDDAAKGIDLDLDVLQPKAGRINYKGSTYTIEPLSLEKYSKLLQLSNELGKFKGSDNPDEIVAIYEKIRAFINVVLPEMTDLTLNTNQITALFSLIAKMNTPEDPALAELKKQGIEVKSGGSGDPKD